MAGRFEAVLDFGCGTATSATLYYLLFYPRAIAIGIDRDCNKKWVEEGDCSRREGTGGRVKLYEEESGLERLFGGTTKDEAARTDEVRM